MSAPSLPPELARWRAGMRAELLARREALSAATRRALDLEISLRLLHGLPVRPDLILGFCWPHRGEYDARPLLRRLREHGVRCALPVVRGREQALIFRAWTPGVAMQRGSLGIAYPADTPQVEPDLLLVPLVGFGRAGDRLGYGGGYFDRTLAAYARRPLAVGVGYEMARIESTFPQPHDVPMDAIVTEAALRSVVGGELVEVTASGLREYLLALERERAEQARRAAPRLG